MYSFTDSPGLPSTGAGFFIAFDGTSVLALKIREWRSLVTMFSLCTKSHRQTKVHRLLHSLYGDDLSTSKGGCEEVCLLLEETWRVNWRRHAVNLPLQHTRKADRFEVSLLTAHFLSKIVLREMWASLHGSPMGAIL